MVRDQIMTQSIQGPSCCADGVSGYGQPNNVMFIGIAPGQDEWRRTKKPFTGQSGKLLDELLIAAGTARSAVYCTNLICWWKDAPTKEDISICATRLKQELAIIKPKLIVLLGKIACESVLGIAFAKARGAVIQQNNQLYLVTNHPAACLHRAVTLPEKEVQINVAYDLARDFNKIPRILANEYKWIEPTYTLINTPHEAQTFLDSIPKTVPVALDIETNYDKEYEKSHPFTSKIICIGIGWELDHCTILTESALVPQLKWPLDVEWTYHNGPFDTQQIAKELGTWLPIKRDTMAASYTYDERSIRGLHKLKVLLRELVGSDFYEEDDHRVGQLVQQAIVKDGKLTLVQAPNEQEQLAKLYLYNAKDVTGTVRLERFLDKKLTEEGVQSVYRNISLPLSEVLARSQLRGIYVSPKNMLEVIDVLEPIYNDTQASLAAMATSAGFPNLNSNSPKQLQAMFESEGLTLPNTRKATLQEYMDTNESPFMSTLLKYRTVHKLLRNYLLDIQKHVLSDSRVHPTAFIIGTSTGRLTYKDPTMNTLPKPKTVGELGIIRKIFAATTPDYILLEADYAQIEAWIAAYLSEDPVLLADLQSGNWHTRTTEDVFKVTKATTTANQWATYYDGGKHLNYGCLFEEGPMGLTRRPPIGMGCDLATAKAYHQRWYQRYNIFDQWRKNIKKQAIADGFIQVPSGRKRHFPFIVNDHQLRQIVNAPIQIIANDYTLMSIIKLAKPFRQLDTHLLFLEHDGTYLEVARRNLDEVKGLLHEVMEAPPFPGMPSVKIEIETGPSLAELEKVVN